ncbi:SH3 domain-containing protein [Heliobacterium gestii]|uniref:SH3 domain-containing protein n=1 Tax=Heliomicrobium gestii TaxID=2699 RepID=A0A845L5W6_HELGE|nr:N-acetylmuramoyl-L-alanine amidase [Heliomicrobium gestii]MBM7865337.1 N-acetylmuramoyl-L-alanine amidase [Heliomicrobium gestii]MZP41598.1 SH3 domain-containing protein [Heliomicrobium gestii]
MKEALKKSIASCLVTLTMSALLLSPATASAAPAAGTFNGVVNRQSTATVVVEGQVVNVRTGPGTGYDIITTVTKGQMLPSGEGRSGWTLVTLPDGRAGWIADWLLTKQPAAPVFNPSSQPTAAATPANNPPSKPTTPAGAGSSPAGSSSAYQPAQKPMLQKDLRAWKATALSPANIRNGPGMTYDVARTASAGESFDLLQVQDGWYQLAQKGQSVGWSASWLFSAQAPATGTTGVVAGVNGSEPSRGVSGTVSTRPVADLLAGKTIVIDPGHGNVNLNWNVVDQGASGPQGSHEKDVTLDVGRRLADTLKARGVNVIMTWTAEQLIRSESDLSYRADMANKAKADLYVSIHCNSHTVPDTSGTTTYYFYKDDDARPGEGTRMRMAGMIQQSLVAALGRRDIGIKGANFAVLRETNMPAVLVELMFISNPEEENLLNQDAVRAKAATAIADGLQRFVEQP